MKNLRTWLITAAIFAAAAGFTIFAGYSITGMSVINAGKNSDPDDKKDKGDDKDKDAQNADQKADADAAEVSDGADINADDEGAAANEGENAAEGGVSASDGTFRTLSQSEIDYIASNYDGTPIYYYTDREMGESGRPLSVEHFEGLLSDCDNVIIYGPNSTAGLTFYLITEYEENITAGVLDTLAAYGVKATFFTSEVYAEAHPDIIRRILDEGHEIGSVGASNANNGLASYGLADQMNDIAGFHYYMESTYGYTMTKFYPNYELMTKQNIKLVTEMGYTYTLFGVNFEDYDHSAEIDVETTYQELVAMFHNGVIYSFHTNNVAVTEILPRLIQYIQSCGFSFTALN